MSDLTPSFLYSVYGGVPARLLRSNTEWSRTFDYHDIPERFALRNCSALKTDHLPLKGEHGIY